MAGNKVLTNPPELDRLYKLREKLANTDREDHLLELDGWERKIKKALIFLNLQGHEGIQQLIAKANEEIREIDEVLIGTRPLDLSGEGALKYTYEAARLHDRRELWSWFKNLFQEANADLKDADQFLIGQEDDPNEGDSYVGKE